MKAAAPTDSLRPTPGWACGTGRRPAQTRRLSIELTLAGHCCHRRAGLGRLNWPVGGSRRWSPRSRRRERRRHDDEFPPSISGHNCSRCSSIGCGSVSSPVRDLNARGHRRAQGRRQPVQHGGRQLDQRHLMGCADTATCWHLSVRARSSASTCWPRRPASDPRCRRALFCLLACETSCSATGARASGRITAPSSPAAPARPPARRPDRRAARTEGEGRRLRHRRVVSCGEVLAAAPCGHLRPGSARNCGPPGACSWCRGSGR